MLKEDQHIIFVAEADIIAQAKKDETREMKTGFACKKIVVTTQRLLIFESLSNRQQETEYQLTSTVAKKAVKGAALVQSQNRARISVSGFPEMSFKIQGFECKVIIEEQPSFYKFLQQQGVQNLVKSVVGIVLLKIPKQAKYYILAMGSISHAIKFAKAIACGQSWVRYRRFCREELKTDPNVLWVRILTEVIHNQDSVVLVDPDLFLSGSIEEIHAFIFLVSIIPFAHCFHHRYSIITPEAASYACEFIAAMENKIHSLSFSRAHMSCANLKLVILKTTLVNLIKLDLSNNSLEDQVFDIVTRVIKAGSKKLSYINLANNRLRLANSQLLVQVLKVATTILNLDLSHNLIDDSTTQTFEKYVIFAFNPPIQQLNLSHNKFSRKIAWRLYVGNIKNFKSHPYLKFLLYPIPIKKEVFGDYDIDFPRHNTTINLNMHSALVEQFQQQSFMRHTFQDMPLTAKDSVTIRFHRVLASNVKLPMNRQQLNRTLQISHKIQNFIYAVQPVEKIYDMALELKRFPFEIPPISRQHFIRYLYEKFNEALFIRDHYSVKYLFRALHQLGVPVDGYTDRLEILKQRDTIFGKRAENVLNLQIEEVRINEELDELVREGLRLYLQGHGIQLLYYLKYRRDQFIEKYLYQKLNPEHFLFDLMAKKNISADQKISQKQFIIPYEIRLQKKINQNFYLHPWQANYQVLSQMRADTFNACLEFLQQSQKKQKFALYFDRIQQRIEFIKNEFTYFSYNKFKASYSDLKINACRLIYLYNNIKDTSIYLEIPLYVKKRLVTHEKNVVILNKEWFKREFHIVHYPNINLKARKANFYNYEGIICRYESQIFQNQAKKILPILSKIFHSIEIAASTKLTLNSVLTKIIDPIKELIDFIRHSLVPQELKEELYLHLISWRRGRYNNNTELLQLIPAFTMYIKPPLQIQKFLVAAILQNDFLDLQDLPLCLATNPNEKTTESVMLLESEFVERDWLPNDKYFCEVFEKRGSITLEIQLMEKTKIVITVAESKTVAELMIMLIDCVEMSCEDKHHFWLYKYNKQTHQIVPFESREHVGEIMADFDIKQSKLVLKRRIYSRQLRYNYNLYGETMINSLYQDIKYEYMCRNFFVNDRLASQIAAVIFIVQGVENTLMQLTNNRSRNNKNTTDEVAIEKIMIDKVAQLDSNFTAYVPRKIYSRLMKSKDGFIAEMKSKISEKFLKKEHCAIFEMKISLLRLFSRFPEFMSSNHRVRSKDKGDMQISINAIYLYVEYENQSQYINLQKLVSIVPKSKYLLLYYHKQENLVAQLQMFAQERAIFALANDLLSYCSLRIKMSSINLYEIYHLQDVEKKIQTMETSLKRVYDKGVEKALTKAREEYQAATRKIVKMSLTLMNFKELQYYNRNHYIKSEINRKLYANKTDKKLDFQTEFDEDQAHEAAAANKKILQMIFPTFELHVNEDQEMEDNKMTQKKFNNDSNQSVDFKKEYEKLNFETTNKKEEPPPPSSPIQRPPVNPYQPPQETSHKTLPKQPEKKAPEQEPEDEVVTGNKPRGRVPRRRNR